ncbi:MAG TPA: glycoside hydrolase family 31 protein [Pyrinomonadaceae bacterium]|jgi:alpha-glucosidase
MNDMLDHFRRQRRQLLCITLLLCCFCLSSFEARGAWRAAGNVATVARETNGVVLTLSSGARVAVTFFDLDVVRVRLSPRGVFERDFSYAVASRDRKTVAAMVRETRDAIEISTQMKNGARIVVNRRPFLVSVVDGEGRVVVEDDAARPPMFDVENGGVEASKRRAAVEMYYGFGEKALAMSRNGQSLVMWNSDTFAYAVGLDPIYQSVPFFIALRQGAAYGLFFDNTARTHFDMGKFAPERYTFGAPSGELNYYVFTGGAQRSPKKILADYSDLTGRTPLPPLWSLGYQQSRYSYYPEAKVREIARGFRQRNIPADVIYLDIDYMEGFRIFTWDKKKFPDPPRMLRDLRADGFRTVVIIDPGIKVDENYPVYTQGRAAGYFHKTADGREFQAKVWPGICAFPDFTDPRVREWFGSLYRINLDEGISGFWTDMNEPATFAPDNRPPQPRLTHDPESTFPLNVRHAGDGFPGDHARYHNVYGMQMARATFEGVRKLRPDERPFVLTRAGYAGVQRFAAVWTGDNVASWEHLQLTIPMLTNMSVSGLAFVGADVGGFANNASAELYTRWLQAAALTPFLRTHVATGLQEREPWSFGDDFTNINRATIELRYRLLPYLYSLFHEHAESGMPVMRPLWFEYPSDITTYQIDQQFLVGRDLLVAPVMQADARKRGVYFPKGDAWLDWWTGKRYEGGNWTEVDAPLNRLPLFVRVGASIPTQRVVQYTGEMSRTPLILVVAHGGDGESRVYQDEGDGYDYQRRRAFRTTNVNVAANTIRLNHTGDFGAARPIVAVEILGLNAKPKEVRADGQKLDTEYDDKRLRLQLLDANVREITLVP